MEHYNTHRPSRRTHERVLIVEAGRVMCSGRGIVDIAVCWTCPAYRGLSGGRFEGVVCNTEHMLLPFRDRTPIE